MSRATICQQMTAWIEAVWRSPTATVSELKAEIVRLQFELHLEHRRRASDVKSRATETLLRAGTSDRDIREHRIAIDATFEKEARYLARGGEAWPVEAPWEDDD